MGHLLDVKDIAGLIETPTTNESVCDVEVGKENENFLKEIIHDPSSYERKFIASPTDIDTHRENKLKMQK